MITYSCSTFCKVPDFHGAELEIPRPKSNHLV